METEKVPGDACCGADCKEEIVMTTLHQQYILLFLFSLQSPSLILSLVLTHGFSLRLSLLFVYLVFLSDT